MPTLAPLRVLPLFVVATALGCGGSSGESLGSSDQAVTPTYGVD